MLNTLFRNLVLALVFGIAFVINPAYITGCGSEDEGPDFGEAEMVALLGDFNAMGVPLVETDNGRYSMAVELSQTEGEDMVATRGPALLASAAHACGNRTFMKSAAACDTQTVMVVEGTLTVYRVDGKEPVLVIEDLPVTGQMRATSDQLRFVSVDLELDGGGTVSWVTLNAKEFTLETFDAERLGEEAVDIHVS